MRERAVLALVATASGVVIAARFGSHDGSRKDDSTSSAAFNKAERVFAFVGCASSPYQGFGRLSVKFLFLERCPTSACAGPCIVRLSQMDSGANIEYLTAIKSSGFGESA